MSNADLIARLRDVDNWWPDGIDAADALEDAWARIRELEGELMTWRHETRLEAALRFVRDEAGTLTQARDRATAALKEAKP